MTISKREAAESLFKLDRAPSLNIFQNKNVFRVEVLTPPKAFSGPATARTPDGATSTEGVPLSTESDPEKISRYATASKYVFMGRIINPKMAHEKFLEEPCRMATANKPEETTMMVALHARIILSTDEKKPPFQEGDVIFAECDPGDNNMLYDLQHMHFVKIDNLFKKQPSLEPCEEKLAALFEGGTFDTVGESGCPWSGGAQQQTTTWSSTKYSEWNGTMLKNGQLEDSSFLETDSKSGAQLIPPAMADFKKLRDAYGAKFSGKTLKVAGYRSYANQEAVRVQRHVSAGVFNCGAGEVDKDGKSIGMAATPGTSNHGWAAAIDVDRPSSGWTGGQEGDSPEFKWLNKYGTKYNFVFGVRNEHWHMDWMPFSAQTTGGVSKTAQSSWVSSTTADYATV